MKSLGSLFVILIFLSSSVCKALDLKLYTSPKTPGVNNSFQLVLEVTKSADDNVESIKPPSFEGLEYLGKSNQTSEQITMEGGKLKRISKSKLLFELIAKKKGEYKVQPFEVIGTSGKIYKTTIFTFNVENKPSSGAQGNNLTNPFGSTGSLFDSLFRRSVPSYDPKYDDLPEDKKSFIEAETNKTIVYEGEQIKLSWWLYTIGDLQNINTLKYPGLSGFWKEDTEQSNRLNFNPVYKNDIQYNRALLSSSSLFPLKPGPNTIDEYQSKITVSLPGRFSYSRAKTSIVSSQSIDIDVLPLPLPQPENFTFGVGAFSLNDSAKLLKVNQNEPFNISLRFEGYGNAKVIEIEKILKFPEAFSLYEVEEKTQFFRNGTSYKLFNVSVIPKQHGEFIVPEQVFTFFDPDLKEYYELKSSEKKISVAKGEAANSIVSEDYQEKGIVEGGTVLALRPLFKLSKVPMSLPKWLWFVLNGLVFLILIGFWLYKRFFKQAKKIMLIDIINSKILKIKSFKDENNYRAFGAEINSAIELLIGKSTLEGSSSYEMTKLIKASSPRLQREYGQSLSEMRQKAELLAFAPEDQAKHLKTQQKIDSLYTEVKDLLLSSCKIIEGEEIEI